MSPVEKPHNEQGQTRSSMHSLESAREVTHVMAHWRFRSHCTMQRLICYARLLRLIISTNMATCWPSVTSLRHIDGEITRKGEAHIYMISTMMKLVQYQVSCGDDCFCPRCGKWPICGDKFVIFVITNRKSSKQPFSNYVESTTCRIVRSDYILDTKFIHLRLVDSTFDVTEWINTELWSYTSWVSFSARTVFKSDKFCKYLYYTRSYILSVTLSISVDAKCGDVNWRWMRVSVWCIKVAPWQQHNGSKKMCTHK